jgi:hypothetical protein
MDSTYPHGTVHPVRSGTLENLLEQASKAEPSYAEFLDQVLR